MKEHVKHTLIIISGNPERDKKNKKIKKNFREGGGKK